MGDTTDRDRGENRGGTQSYVYQHYAYTKITVHRNREKTLFVQREK